MTLELQFFQLFIILPFLGFVLSLFIPDKKETLISWTAFSTVGLHFFLALGFVVHWILNGHLTLNLKEIVLYESSDYSFFVDFYFSYLVSCLSWFSWGCWRFWRTIIKETFSYTSFKQPFISGGRFLWVFGFFLELFFLIFFFFFFLCFYLDLQLFADFLCNLLSCFSVISCMCAFTFLSNSSFFDDCSQII